MNTESKNSSSFNEIDQKLDDQFVAILSKIQSRYLVFNRHVQIRIEKWVEKLVNYDDNTVWRKIRNNYIGKLYDMVRRGKVEGIFLRMPPEKDLPHFTQIQNRRFFQDSSLASKQQQNNYQISIKKIEQPCGDSGSEITTPNCQTQRTFSNNKFSTSISDTISKDSKMKSVQQVNNQKDANKCRITMSKLINLFTKYDSTFKKDSNYQEIVSCLNQLINRNNPDDESNTLEIMEEGGEEEQSTQLRVEEGIQLNKANLFQFGSPRGMTQMQYFKAALQL